MVVRAVLVVLLLASHATAETVKPPSCGPAKQTTKAPSSVRAVDWCNFDFGFWKGPLREGRSEVHLDSDMGGANPAPHDTIAVSLRGVIYGDLDGDRRPEAAVVLQKTTWIGRTGESSGGTSVYIYSLANGKPTLLGSVPAGTPVDAVSLGKGIITVTSGPKGQKETMRFRRAKDDFERVPAKKSTTP